ncbi:MAG: TIGR01459 family HAD-type hydrolase [Hyphomicrobiaceae bacterium]
MRELASNYDAVLCDIWGVVHNGRDAFPEAHKALSAFRKSGGTVVLVSNAPRPWTEIAPQLENYGVPDHAWDAIVTSGDVTRHLIEADIARPMFHLGPPRDKPVFAGLDVNLVGEDDAQVVVNTGLFDDHTETPDDYRERFADLVARNVRMICANPDLLVERGDEIVHCAGGLAALYTEMGGDVAYAGKPYLPIYEMAGDLISEIRGAPISADRTLAIGDGLKTDIAGAAAAGMDALFVPSGIHLSPGEDRDQNTLNGLFANAAVKPVGAIDGLRW